jgi:hypothetical protein
MALQNRRIGARGVAAGALHAQFLQQAQRGRTVTQCGEHLGLLHAKVGAPAPTSGQCLPTLDLAP